MRLFLASYRFGGYRDEFVRLTGGPCRIGIVANACDAWAPTARASALASECGPLRRLGYEPVELDLRTARDPALLDTVDAVWLRGGNTFVLAARLASSGLAGPLVERVRSGRLVYAGYSAGACLAAPTLRGLEHVDDPAEVDSIGERVCWDGLGLVDAVLAVHHGDSPLAEPGTAASEQALRDLGPEVRYLTDDDVWIVRADPGEGGHRTPGSSGAEPER